MGLSARTEYLLQAVNCVLTPAQRAILPCTAQTILVTGGEQAGKSWLAAMKFIHELVPDIIKAKAAGYPFPLVYWLVAADYDRTEKEFYYIKDALDLLGLLHDKSKRVDPGWIEVGGGPPGKPVTAIVRTRSSKDYRTLGKEAPMGIIGCEASQLELEAYLRLVSRQAPHRAWFFMTGTMESSLGWYPQLRQAWATGQENKRSFSLPSYSNHYLYPGGKDDPAILQLKADTPDDFFMERIEGIPCPPRGLVLPEFIPDIHVSTDCVYVPGQPITIWYDPGYDHAAALEGVQHIDGQVRVFTEIYEHGWTVDQIIDHAVVQPWWTDVRHGVIDIAGTYHAGQQAPVSQVWLAKTGLYMSNQKVPINEGTARFKSFLKVDEVTHRPKIVFSPTCRGVISELGGCLNPIDNQMHVYRWHVDKEGNAVGQVPIDRWNDGIKAVVYGLVDRFGYVTVRPDTQVGHIKFFGRPRTDKVAVR